jgi:hypothetical protein
MSDLLIVMPGFRISFQVLWSLVKSVLFIWLGTNDGFTVDPISNRLERSEHASLRQQGEDSNEHSRRTFERNPDGGNLVRIK